MSVFGNITKTLLLVTPIFLATQGNANEADNRCVQEQLTNLGFDPRGIDGNFGPGTQAAFAAYLAQIDARSDLTLDEASAESWCIHLTLVSACRDLDSGFAAFSSGRFIGSRKMGGYSQLVGAFVSESGEEVTGYIAQYSPYFPDRARCEEYLGFWEPEAGQYVLGDISDTSYGGWVFGPEQIERIRAERVSMEQFRTLSNIQIIE